MKCVQIRVRGQVQGVGFRPFVWTLANELNLAGHVLNDPQGVLVYAAGEQAAVLAERIKTEAPPLSQVTAVEVSPASVETLPFPFEITASQGQGSQTRITPDAATCSDCLSELRDPDDRRFGYAFANCTNCGPRFTIIKSMPYDRAKTTMARFELCDVCAAEYANPADRRFHAQPVACTICGPDIWLEGGSDDDPIEAAIEMLRAGKILAVKGLGGFHLVCDASNSKTLMTLRQRKRRPSKPFALMGTLSMIRSQSNVSKPEAKLLTDPAAPIVLLESKTHSLPNEIAPGQNTLGWMVPYTPLHHLLMDGFGGPLVMTSGNLSGEPQVIANEEARQKLSPFVDGFLMHNRDIARRLDDSVERAHPPMVLRRARGRVPTTLLLPPGFEGVPQVVAYGGQMKGAICLVKDGSALLGHHLGDLNDALTLQAFEQADRDYTELFEHQPTVAACDLHPEFAATRHAFAKGLQVEQVQHHHAHLAACLGENLWPMNGGRVAGIVLDGLGLGPDGTVWGGEVLLCDYASFERRAWLKPAPLPGGDGAQKEPWRNALVRLDDAGLEDWADELFANQPRDLLRQAVRAGINAPLSSSAGRLFDAVAACIGICPDTQSYEGEAAMQLEALAAAAPPEEAAYGYPITFDGTLLDPSPMWPLILYDLEKDLPREVIALRFHAALATAFARAAQMLVDQGGAEAVALSGGCFQNALLQDLMVQVLGDVPLLIHRKTPANDGGLALGQALVAAAKQVETS